MGDSLVSFGHHSYCIHTHTQVCVQEFLCLNTALTSGICILNSTWNKSERCFELTGNFKSIKIFPGSARIFSQIWKLGHLIISHRSFPFSAQNKLTFPGSQTETSTQAVFISLRRSFNKHAVGKNKTHVFPYFSVSAYLRFYYIWPWDIQ